MMPHCLCEEPSLEKQSVLALQALNNRLQHGALDAHARQRAMRRDMRAVTIERQINNGVAPVQPLPLHAAFPGPPPDPGAS